MILRGMVENKINDFVRDNVAVENRQEARALAHQALESYEAKTLTKEKAQNYFDRMLELVRPARRKQLEQSMKKNQKMFDRLS